MDTEVDYITEEKKKELEIELVQLSGPRRKEILDALEFAKSLGDLSENAEYHQAREDQAKLEERISKIEYMLMHAKVVSRHHSTIVEVGATVVIQKKGSTEKKKVQIVGVEEADMAQGKISTKSPLGAALFAKKKGDTASFTTPSGAVEYKILDIE
ncbi:MAG: transcription elongation factor GreA [Candidatus Pacebacteria bacterium]|jgi:transcription elongation factor GreA|nr:transcription elongation factor GreA [Candidatus Paceibacterota bacterium]